MATQHNIAVAQIRFSSVDVFSMCIIGSGTDPTLLLILIVLLAGGGMLF